MPTDWTPWFAPRKDQRILQTLWWTLSHSPNPQRRQGILARTAALRWDLVIEFDANDWSRYLTRHQRADARPDERRRHSLARHDEPIEAGEIERRIIESQHCVKGFYIIGVKDCPVWSRAWGEGPVHERYLPTVIVLSDSLNPSLETYGFRFRQRSARLSQQ